MAIAQDAQATVAGASEETELDQMLRCHLALFDANIPLVYSLFLWLLKCLSHYNIC